MMTDIYNKVALELNLDVMIVKEAYKSYWRTIKDIIQGLPLKRDLSEQEFNSIRPNFNIRGLGKLGVTSQKYKGVKRKFNYIHNDKAEES